MNKFLIKILLFSLLISAFVLLIFVKADGYSDPFYERFTTPQQKSMIIGASRAAQGIRPDILNDSLSRKDIYNFSFTIAHSPYGPVYLEALKRKLDKNSKEGIFILDVNPWGISSKSKDPNDISGFRERNCFLADEKLKNSNPNFRYLFKYYEEYKIDILTKKSYFLNNDGWLELLYRPDTLRFQKNTKIKLRYYKNKNLPVYNFSSLRFEYLIKTINYLKSHGMVYLVRLPVHPEMQKIDDALMPDFNEKINELCELTDVAYFDMTNMNSQFLYTDGNHLYRGSGKEVSSLIAKWIKNDDTDAH